MKKIIILIYLHLLVLNIFAIEFSLSEDNTIPLLRDVSIENHENRFDSGFYGTSHWAVNFNIPSLTNKTGFHPTKINIYFPDASYEDIESLQLVYGNFLQTEASVSQEITSSTPAVQGWNSFDVVLQENVSVDTFFVVLNIPTSSDARMATSLGNGVNSYYGEESNDTISWENFLSNGFNFELLFSVEGYFISDTPDYSLEEIIINDINLHQPLDASVRIKNINDASVESDNLKMIMQFTPADDEPTIIDTILISQPVLANSEIIESLPDIFMITSENCIYKLMVTLTSENDAFNANNSKFIYFNTFTRESPPLMECFLRDNIDEDFVNDIHNWIDIHNETKVLSYYPVATDSLFNIASLERKNYYDIGFTPFLIHNGIDKIIGYEPHVFDNYINDFSATMTFLSLRNAVIYYKPILQTMTYHIELINNDNFVFNNTLTGYNAYLIIAQKNINNIGDTVIKILENDDNISILNGEVRNFDFELDLNSLFTYNNVNFTSELDEFSIYFVIQNENTKHIYFSEQIEAELVSNENVTIPTKDFVVYPNPTRNTVQIKSSYKSKDGYNISLYNILGQCILQKKLSDLKSNSFDFNELNVSSGIYFFKLEDSEFNTKQIQKIIYLK